ncbi:CBM96 family carbohydrate-binding protein [Paenibacillus sp. strain BS8-2]
MKKVMAIALAALLVASTPNLVTGVPIAHAAAEESFIQTYKIFPTADTYVRDGAYENDSYGAEAELLVGNGRESYLQFDLSEIDPEQVNLISANLNLYKTDKNTNTIGVNLVPSDNWNNSITYATKPEVGDSLTSLPVGGQFTLKQLDLPTESIAAEASTDGKLSLRLERIGGQYPSGFATSRAADESQRPYLEVTALSNEGIVEADKMELMQLNGKQAKIDLQLPLLGTYGSTISWSSDKPDVLENSGVVHRPEAGTGNVDVTLTANVQYRNAVSQVQLIVTVMQQVSAETLTLYPEVDTYVRDGAAYANVSNGASDEIVVGNGREMYMRFNLEPLRAVNEEMIMVDAVLNLYKKDTNSNTLVVTEVEDDSWDGSITWNTKPSFGDEVATFNVKGSNVFVNVSLIDQVKAELNDDNGQMSIRFERLPAKYPSGFHSTRSELDKRPYLQVTAMTHEAVMDAAAEEVLYNRATTVYTDFDLPTTGKYGATISWSSSRPDVIANDGTVTRPTDGDVQVTLTATINSGSASRDYQMVYLVPQMKEIIPAHPQAYVQDSEKGAVQNKIDTQNWAAQSYQKLLSEIDSLVNKTQTDPDYVTSRMSMYWKEGERYTQGYLKSQMFDYGEGNAPVPTVRLPGMRIWNEYANVPFADRLEYSEDGSMLGVEKNVGNAEQVLIPYKETGHLIWQNNAEILQYAQKAAFIYWLTNDEKYAKFAADIYWQWLLGTYYMNPPLDPEKSLGGPGGYEPGGISGYYDYEVIHDSLGREAALTYDFLYDYLIEHVDEYVNENIAHDEVVLEKDVTKLSGIVFKRFIDIGFVRGAKSSNWNVNGWNTILPIILSLESNDYYSDFKGKEHYLQYYTTYSTQYHDAVPDIMKDYNPVTGLWPESPGYAFGTIATILNHSLPVYKQGVDIVAINEIVEKAATAPLSWLDPRGLIIRLGDGGGGLLDYNIFEQLATYYQWTGNQAKQDEMTSIIQAGIEAGFYTRDKGNLYNIIFNVDELTPAATLPWSRTAYSEFHRHVLMKNLNDTENGLMATLSGGVSGGHLHENGLSMQLYGKGWALGPNTHSYESYWSEDYAITRRPAGSNTIVPGYAHGPVTVNAIEPAPAPGELTNANAISDYVQFSDLSASEKRRQVSIIRTSPTTGYYVDVFRSDQIDNDYIYHNLGDEMVVMDDAGQPLALTPDDNFTGYGQYEFFENPEKIDYTGDFNVEWTINRTEPDLKMAMWMKGQENRTIYAVDSYKSSRSSYSAPEGIGFDPTPTVIVRQNANNAWTAPFVAVFEPFEGDNKSIERISDFGTSGNFAGVQVESKPLSEELEGRKEYILSASDNETYSPNDMIDFKAMYGVASINDTGFQYLYLGQGQLIRYGDFALSADVPVAASLEPKEEGYVYSSTGAVAVTLPYDVAADAATVKLSYEVNGQWTDASQMVVDEAAHTISALVPAGYDVLLRVEAEVTEQPGEHWAAATVSGPATAHAGQSVTLNVGVDQVEQGFNAMDVIVQYDPSKLEFEMTTGENGVMELAEEAVSSTRDNFHIIATAVRPTEGQIRIIAIGAGENGLVTNSGALFELNGRIKADAPLGHALTSLAGFEVSRDGTAGMIHIAGAYHSTTIGQTPVNTDKSALEQAIATAQALLSKAVEGDKIGQYAVGSKAILQTAIGTANAVLGNNYATQAQVDAATGALHAANQQFRTTFISLVEGQTQITIRDLSIIAKYFGATSQDPNWNDIVKADLFGEGEINIRVLAAIAQMILTDWGMSQ